MAKFEPENVFDASTRRDCCRVGLNRLRMKHLPTGREIRCYGSFWDYHKVTDLPGEVPLILDTIPPRIQPPASATQEEIDRFERGEMLGYTLDWLVDDGLGLDPDFNPHLVYAKDCVLLEKWPVYCCRPSRRKLKA